MHKLVNIVFKRNHFSLFCFTLNDDYFAWCSVLGIDIPHSIGACRYIDNCCAIVACNFVTSANWFFFLASCENLLRIFIYQSRTGFQRLRLPSQGRSSMPALAAMTALTRLAKSMDDSPGSRGTAGMYQMSQIVVHDEMTISM